MCAGACQNHDRISSCVGGASRLAGRTAQCIRRNDEPHASRPWHLEEGGGGKKEGKRKHTRQAIPSHKTVRRTALEGGLLLLFVRLVAESVAEVGPPRHNVAQAAEVAVDLDNESVRKVGVVTKKTSNKG